MFSSGKGRRRQDSENHTNANSAAEEGRIRKDVVRGKPIEKHKGLQSNIEE